METKDTISSCSETKDVHAIKYEMSKSKHRCMAYFRSLHSHLQVLSKEDLKGTRIEHGFKWAFMSLFGQDNENFTSTMLLNIDQLQKQLDKDEFQEDGFMATFWVDMGNALDDGLVVTESNGIESKMQDESSRTRHKRQYDRRVNKRQMQMQMQKSKVDMGNALDDGLVVTESNGIESKMQDESSRSGDDTADIRPIYDEEPMAEEVNSRKVRSHKTRHSNKRVEQKSHIQKPNRQIFTRHKFSLNKSFVVYEKTSPRSDLRWKPTGKILNIVGLRWVPTGKLLDSYTNKADSKSTHGSNADMSKVHECKQTLDLNAGKSQSVVAEKADISETSVTVDSQMMKSL
uniref:Zinc finger, CCHC-type n=1 Tax=Tanacetum cinerariifolium TaxID=118510 RepID=A0A6L2MD34_TANCI|nr:hypothetical protein [Tanacetum cinerariifolium]